MSEQNTAPRKRRIVADGVTADVRLLAGRYQIGELLGRGGMADVHVGMDARLGRRVAIKLLKPSLANDPAFRTRFRQEAQAAARMAHPTIVRVFDAGEETVRDPSGHEIQVPFIVMEHVDGRLLKDIVGRGPARPGRGRAHRRRHPGRPRVLAPRRRRAPRHQAGQRHGHLVRPGQGHGLRHRARDLRLVGDDRPDQRDPRHRPVLLARAGARRGRRRPHRPVLHRRRALRTAHRAAAVPGRDRGRDRLPARQRGADRAERHQPRRSRRRSTRSSCARSRRTASSATRRPPTSASDLEIALAGKVPDRGPVADDFNVDPVRRQPERGARVRGDAPPPRRRRRRPRPAHADPTAGRLDLGHHRARRRSSLVAAGVLDLQPRAPRASSAATSRSRSRTSSARPTKTAATQLLDARAGPDQGRRRRAIRRPRARSSPSTPRSAPASAPDQEVRVSVSSGPPRVALVGLTFKTEAAGEGHHRRTRASSTARPASPTRRTCRRAPSSASSCRRTPTWSRAPSRSSRVDRQPRRLERARAGARPRRVSRSRRRRPR